MTDRILNTGRGDREITVTKHWGGQEKGQMVQITQGFAGLISLPEEPGFIQLTTRDAYILIAILTNWLKETAHSRAEKLSLAIKENQALQKTVIHEAIECESFIQDLKILEIPLRLLGVNCAPRETEEKK